jgi:uncharacterized membrane protein
MTGPAAAATGLIILAAWLSAQAQVWLKESALMTPKSRWAEFWNARVIGGYALLSLTLPVNAWALRWLSFKWSVALGSTAYIFVIFLSRRRFGETLSSARRWGAGLILAGLLLFPL